MGCAPADTVRAPCMDCRARQAMRTDPVAATGLAQGMPTVKAVTLARPLRAAVLASASKKQGETGVSLRQVSNGAALARQFDRTVGDGASARGEARGRGHRQSLLAPCVPTGRGGGNLASSVTAALATPRLPDTDRATSERGSSCWWASQGRSALSLPSRVAVPVVATPSGAAAHGWGGLPPTTAARIRQRCHKRSHDLTTPSCICTGSGPFNHHPPQSVVATITTPAPADGRRSPPAHLCASVLLLGPLHVLLLLARVSGAHRPRGNSHASRHPLRCQHLTCRCSADCAQWCAPRLPRSHLARRAAPPTSARSNPTTDGGFGGEAALVGSRPHPSKGRPSTGRHRHPPVELASPRVHISHG
eukprot:scaffold7203_cov416-Prasinococcus_capsulatus_cf.AAC.16